MVFWIPIAVAVAAAAAAGAALLGGDDDEDEDELHEKPIDKAEQQAEKTAALIKNRTKRSREVREFAKTHQLSLTLRRNDSTNDSPTMIIKALNQAVQQRTDVLNQPVRALDKELEELSQLSSQLQKIIGLKSRSLNLALKRSSKIANIRSHHR